MMQNGRRKEVDLECLGSTPSKGTSFQSDRADNVAQLVIDRRIAILPLALTTMKNVFVYATIRLVSPTVAP